MSLARSPGQRHGVSVQSVLNTGETVEHQTLFSNSFLRSVWSHEFESFLDSDTHRQLQARLRSWASRDVLKETSSATPFISEFFANTWNYYGSGQGSDVPGYTYYPEYPVSYAGQQGGTGSADIALGWFGDSPHPDTPQLLGEFKDVRAGLDAPQNRKGNTRSPVKQCADYLTYSRRAYYGNEAILPSWGLVTDMNEFRLYHWKSMPERYQRFVVKGDGQEPDLIGEGADADFARFVFWKLFQPDELLSTGGASPLERLLEGQFVQEKAIESEFYKEYQALRRFVFESLVEANPEFPGTRGKLVRLTQRFLDRCIFLFFCEDKGEALDFPRNLLRDHLIELSKIPGIGRESGVAWSSVKELFDTMRTGGVFGQRKIGRFNGGLFEQDQDLNDLHVPAKVFFEPGQGVAGADSIAAHPRTVLYLSAMYNFGAAESGDRNAISLYTLGRIFEQSITELEIMEAEAEGRLSINKLSKRKRDGVYYTPEWVVEYIVDEVIGGKFLELRHAAGLTGEVSEQEAELYRTGAATVPSNSEENSYSANRKGEITRYVNALRTYEDQLAELKIVDPACGSGAFLIRSLQKLLEERRWISNERLRVTGKTELFDQDSVIKSLLGSNIYGVDINPESVEIARLALWLHTALPGKPLSTLDDNIVCGNSLVGEDFFQHRQGELFDEEDIERINPFNWQEAFPEVFERENPGFDCVVGNPPYVKLQNFRKVLEDVADYLVNAKEPSGSPVFASTQTGNFDLYLPFIERGVDLLRDDGRLGYIAPSVWTKNDYGEGLRKHIRGEQTLYKWIDFGSYQVFDEATTYTALQFYTTSPQPGVEVVIASDSQLADLGDDTLLPYERLDSEAWDLRPASEMKLLDAIRGSSRPLSSVAERIFVGIQTSANPIYHLQQTPHGHYSPIGADEVHELEAALLHPLVRGPDVKRYTKPAPELVVLVPYDLETGELVSQAEMREQYPLTWEYLKRNEDELRARESGKMDVDDGWWGYNYPKNLTRQLTQKLLVAQTVQRMEVCADLEGKLVMDNVRVNGISHDEPSELWFLLACLNGPVVDYVFRRTAKPKDNGYFEANKQFIAPLPIPVASEGTKERIGALGQKLEELYSTRQNLIEKVERRLASAQCEDIDPDESWLWGAVKPWREFLPKAPDELSRRDRNRWAKAQRAELVDTHTAPLDALLVPGATLCVRCADSELRLLINDIAAITGIFAPQREADFIAAQWRHAIRGLNVTESFDGKRLVATLLSLRSTRNDALIDQILALDAELANLEDEIDETVKESNELLYSSYGLSPEQARMIEGA